MQKNPSSFTKMVESVPGLLHETIPPGAHTYQADVETAHRLIEDELYNSMLSYDHPRGDHVVPDP